MPAWKHSTVYHWLHSWTDSFFVSMEVIATYQYYYHTNTSFPIDQVFRQKFTHLKILKSWIDSKSHLHLDPCVTCCGLIHWKILAMKSQTRNTLRTIRCEVVPTFILMEHVANSYSKIICCPSFELMKHRTLGMKHLLAPIDCWQHNL